MPFKLLPSKLLHGVYVFLELEELLFFLYNCVCRYAGVGNELIISDDKQEVCGDQGIDA
jgi:hypothetical protein